jgi:hypothetical protein
MAIIEWNGSDIPDALRRLPAGRYVVEPVEDLAALSADEEDGLVQALASLRAGRGLGHDVVRARVLNRV